MRRKMITVSAALALMLSVAGCKDKAPEETTPATTTTAAATTTAATTTEAVNVTDEPTAAAPATTAEATTAKTEPAPETTPEATTASVGPLTIVKQPQDVSVNPDSYAKFTVEATSEKPITYLWQYRMNEKDTWKTSPHDGATSNTHSVFVSAHTDWDGVQFRCVVSDSDGTPIYSKPATLHINIPVTSEYFPNENFRKYVSTTFDLDHDEVLSPFELQHAKEICIVDGANLDNTIFEINDLTGIEYFQNLEYLSCDKCSLKDLDISKNTKLTRLFCECNQLSTLDISQNTMLERVYCNGNPLVTLTLGPNDTLQILNCYNAPLSSLDVSMCPTLGYLGVDDTVTIIGANDALQIQPHRHVTVENGLIDEDGNLHLKDGVYNWVPVGVIGDPTHENFSGAIIENGFYVFHGSFNLFMYNDNFECTETYYSDSKLAKLPLDENARFWGTGGTGPNEVYDADELKLLFYDDYQGLDCFIHIENGKITQIDAAS
ncbi:MAG: hypothetical protein IKX10_05610 [Lachnospiraceae bacterium]|nr:hypothetical protein [Lachnospiraceae bacterium]